MTRGQRKTQIKAFYAPIIYGELDRVVDEVYTDVEDYLKTQMNNQKRDFRDRCIFREVLEHIGGSDDTR